MKIEISKAWSASMAEAESAHGTPEAGAPPSTDAAVLTELAKEFAIEAGKLGAAKALGAADGEYESAALAAKDRFETALRMALAVREPIDMVLHCPKCGKQHIDAAEQTWLEALQSKYGPDAAVPPEAVEAHKRKWSNPPHRSHLCHSCGHIWRPADVATNGVVAVKTVGKADSPLHPAPKGNEP